jgi:hypothetical protein
VNLKVGRVIQRSNSDPERDGCSDAREHWRAAGHDAWLEERRCERVEK